MPWALSSLEPDVGKIKTLAQVLCGSDRYQNLQEVWHRAARRYSKGAATKRLQLCVIDAVNVPEALIEPGIAHEFETYGRDHNHRIVTSVLRFFSKHLKFE